MTDIKNTFAAKVKNLFELYESDGTHHIFIRPGKRWYDIAKREVLAKDKSIPKGYVGYIPDATLVHPQEVAYILTQQEARIETLERIEGLLREYIDLKRSTREARQKPKQLQKKEVLR